MTIENLLLSITMALAAGLVGCFVIMRRMALAAAGNTIDFFAGRLNPSAVINRELLADGRQPARG